MVILRDKNRLIDKIVNFPHLNSLFLLSPNDQSSTVHGILEFGIEN